MDEVVILIFFEWISLIMSISILKMVKIKIIDWFLLVNRYKIWYYDNEGVIYDI